MAGGAPRRPFAFGPAWPQSDRAWRIRPPTAAAVTMLPPRSQAGDAACRAWAWTTGTTGHKPPPLPRSMRLAPFKFCKSLQYIRRALEHRPAAVAAILRTAFLHCNKKSVSLPWSKGKWAGRRIVASCIFRVATSMLSAPKRSIPKRRRKAGAPSSDSRPAPTPIPPMTSGPVARGRRAPADGRAGRAAARGSAPKQGRRVLHSPGAGGIVRADFGTSAFFSFANCVGHTPQPQRAGTRFT